MGYEMDYSIANFDKGPLVWKLSGLGDDKIGHEISSERFKPGLDLRKISSIMKSRNTLPVIKKFLFIDLRGILKSVIIFLLSNT